MNIDPHGLLGKEEHDLVKILNAAAAEPGCPPFVVIQGLRTIAQEAANVSRGASQTMHSRHLPDRSGLAAAVDVACLDGSGKITWDAVHYIDLAPFIKRAAKMLGLLIEWGGDWKTLKDFGHWQLPWAQYP